MRIKKLVIPVMTLIILTSQLAGCAVMPSAEMVSMIDKGQTITIELAEPSYKVSLKGKQQESIDWVQLDQLKTFNDGFRQGVDELFNINIVSENGINGKSGSLYVDDAGNRNGNTTLEDALRNKVFVTKYWNDSKVKDGLSKLAEDAYTDTSGNTAYSIAGTLNAYYNLMTDADNPSAFNPTQSLTRDDFYALVYKTENGVSNLEASVLFESSTGGKTDLSIYSQGVHEYGFLSLANKSLDANSCRGSISRAEAVYMMVNKHFSDQLVNVTGKEKAYSDTKNAGDLALKAGFKVRDKDTKEVIAKDRWQSYTLAQMMINPDKGMQEDLYKTMVVAKNLGLISGEKSRWDEPISKSEALMLVVNTHLAKNSLYGFKSEVEYGTMEENSLTITQEGSEFVIDGINDEGYAYGVGWVESTPGLFETDPYDVTKTGRTLGHVKLVLINVVDMMKEAGASDAEIHERLVYAAEDMGTDYETAMGVDLNKYDEDWEAKQAQAEKEKAEEQAEKDKVQAEKDKVQAEKDKVQASKPAPSKPAPAKPAPAKPAPAKPAPAKPAPKKDMTAQERYDSKPDWMKKKFVDPSKLETTNPDWVTNPFVDN